jgi:hypothetical protein
MLDAEIIDWLRRREREQEEGNRLPLELPLDPPPRIEEETSPPPSDRGIIIIDL